MAGHLWLVGMMGSGKSCTATVLGERFGLDVIDTDSEISRRTGCSIAQLWGERGEEAFRSMESAAVDRAAAGPPTVISTGGGAVLADGNIAAMRESGSVVWLAAGVEVLAGRVGNGAGRPLLEEGSAASDLERILSQRRDRYASVADLIVVTDDLSVAETADRIEAWWSR